MSSKGNENRIELKNLTLKYGQFHALQNVDFSIRNAEIHAVIGEHGAGKSSLAQVISGYKKPDSGRILLNGSPLYTSNPFDAKENGIEIVMQEIEQYERLSLAQNLFGNSPDFFKKKFFTRKELNSKTDEFFKSLGFEFTGKQRIFNLKDTEKVLIELLKHLLPEPKLLILDETFEKMTAVDLNKIIPILKQRKSEGLSILFITHRIDDVYTFADRVTVIRNGRILTTEYVKNIDKINLIKLAYTQVVQESSLNTTNQEFYQLLKYNRAILETLPINLIVIDENQIIRLMNNNAKAYFSIGDTPLLGSKLMNIKALTDNAGLYEQLYSSMEKHRLESFTTRLTHPNGKETINVITVYPIYDGVLFIGSMIIISDITKEENLRQKLDFSERLGSVGLLAAGVSHEINNPLEIIMNEVEYLRRLLPEEKHRKVLNNIEEEVDSIEQIVSSLAAFSDNSQTKVEEIDLNSLLSHIINLVKYNAVQRNIDIQFSTPEEPVMLSCNRTEIKQIVLNLIKNSFEAIHSDGTLEIKLSKESMINTSWIKLVVRDTGPGISEEDKKNIFLPFFSKKTSNGINMGLGLSVSYGIINKMNGKISVENHAEGGCIFTIRLPE
ncbi:MAG: ATP-binding cassette domain-containing protein [Spirochaetales bacterium]|uniref:histidine kinase n=1 Tax=Candidatus Thalassospirochaeta sargassi TaxID=3119039 RepID=A0AAJ1MJZ7_9SPIO|nr:ATP-binding cassette domain-containing protein [Spirochaetales bacterium]